MYDRHLTNANKHVTETIGLARENVQVANNSMNMLKYAKIYLGKAEPLQQLTAEDAYSVIKYKNPKKSNTKAEEYVKTVIHKVNHNLFSSFVGDMIIDEYTPKSSKHANIIATDISRLCFIIMHKVKNKKTLKEKEWINDKSGKKFIELVLVPALAAIKEIITDFISTSNKGNPSLSTVDLMILRGKCAELNRDLMNDKYTTSILKHVAPKFHFDELKLIDDKPTKKKK